MKRILYKEDVAKALASLTSEKGKKPTLAALHAALGNRGSLSTLVQLVEEIEATQQPASEAGDAFNTFREIWVLAMDEGRKYAETRIKELTDTQNALCQENNRLDGAASASQERAAVLEKEKSALQAELVQTKADLEKRLNEAQAALIESGNQTRLALEKVSQAQTAHATELAALYADRDAAIKANHAAEIALAATNARLEAQH